MIKLHAKKGFSLVELLVVVSIISFLASIVFAALNNSKQKATDAKIASQLKSMSSQATLYTGSNNAVAAGSGAVNVPISSSGNDIFTSPQSTASLNQLINGMPAGTVVYYASDGVSPSQGGKWAVAASTPTGSRCIDYTAALQTQVGTVMTTATSGPDSALTLYSGIPGSYSCGASTGGGPVCTIVPVQMTFSPVAQHGTANSQRSYNLTIANNDTSICNSPANLNVHFGLPSGWTVNVNNFNWPQTNPGDAWASQFTITSASGAVDGTYDITATATDSTIPVHNSAANPSARFIIP